MVTTFFYKEVHKEVDLNKKEQLFKKIAVDAMTEIHKLDGLVTALQHIGLDDNAIGIEDESMLPGTLSTLQDKISGKLESASDIIRRIRMVNTEEDIALEDGMVIEIETPYYEFGLGALAVEDPFVIASEGNIMLTSLDRQIHIIE